MSLIKDITREAAFTSRDRAFLIWMFTIVCLSALSVYFGLVEVSFQNETLEKLRLADQQDRGAEAAKQQDWGSAAYYQFHLTYDAPSAFAFAAMGQRDLQPWKHRIRMLALEGQIYERDAGNPSIAMVGRFDFAFFAAFIVPLILIMLLYDLRSSEKVAGRHDLLEATSSGSLSLWSLRACLRAGMSYLCIMLPVVLGGLISGATPQVLCLAGALVLGYVAFWTLLCHLIAARGKSGPMTLMTLMGIWVFTAVIIPASARLVIDRLVPVPSGAEILLLQRETVNDAWDLPRETTMNAFFERHPQWADYEAVNNGFEWQWYYAFQQVGDQKTEPLTTAYREGRIKRDRLANWVALIAPPSLLERQLQALAGTDLRSVITYEDRVRAYHGELRAFYYPKFFQNQPFDRSNLEQMPEFAPNP